jgi:hypothetical protein
MLVRQQAKHEAAARVRLLRRVKPATGEEHRKIKEAGERCKRYSSGTTAQQWLLT